MPLSLRVSVLLISCLTLAPRAVAASEGPSASSTSAGGAESPRVPPPPTYTPSAVTRADTRPRTADGLLAPDPNKRFAPYETPTPRSAPARRGERLMIAGYSLLGAGLTVTAIGVTAAYVPPEPDPLGVNDDHGYPFFFITLPNIAIASLVTLTGAALVGGGYGRWRREHREWASYGLREGPREPLRANPNRLIIPGAVMLVTAPLVAGLCSSLYESPLVLAPGGLAMGTGAALLTAGLVQRRRHRRRATPQLTPTAGRTRDGTWTGGLVVRW